MNNPNSPPTLVLLYSQNSPKCTQLRAMVKDEHLGFFNPICVDNSQVRNMINNSTTLKIKSVPCIIEVFPDGNLASYEDIKAFEWMNNFNSILDQKPNPRPTKPVHRNDRNGDTRMQGVSSGIPNVREIDTQLDDGRDYSSQMAAMGGGNVRNMDEIDMAPKNPNLSALRGPRRSAYRGEIDEENNQYTGITSERDVRHGELSRPMRGNGHDGMSSSSLPDMDMGGIGMPMEQQRSRRQIPISAGKNRVKIIEDITPDEDDEDVGGGPVLSDDDPSGMTIPREDGGVDIRTNKSKERSNNLKNMAMSIERARKSEEEQIESTKKGNTIIQREMSMNQPISL